MKYMGMQNEMTVMSMMGMSMRVSDTASMKGWYMALF